MHVFLLVGSPLLAVCNNGRVLLVTVTVVRPTYSNSVRRIARVEGRGLDKAGAVAVQGAGTVPYGRSLMGKLRCVTKIRTVVGML